MNGKQYQLWIQIGLEKNKLTKDVIRLQLIQSSLIRCLIAMFLLIELHINICIQLFLGCQWVVALDWSSSWLHNQPIEMHNKLERNTELYLCEIRMTNWFGWIVHFYIWKSMKWMFVVVEMMRFEMKHFQMVFVHRSEYCLWFSHFLRTKERAKSRKTKTNLKNGISNHLKNVDECFEKYSLCPFLSHSDQIP